MIKCYAMICSGTHPPNVMFSKLLEHKSSTITEQNKTETHRSPERIALRLISQNLPHTKSGNRNWPITPETCFLPMAVNKFSHDLSEVE